MSECADKKFEELRHSEGDVVEAIQEQMWTHEWQRKMFAAYLTGTDEERGKLVKEMIDEELYRVASEDFCEEI